MSILNTKDNQDKTKKTSAKKATKATAIIVGCLLGTSIIAASVNIGASIYECQTHKGLETCQMMGVIEKFEGQEKALEHHMNHLKNNSTISEVNINYSEDEYYDIPNGYEFKTDENGTIFGYSRVEASRTIRINEDGEEIIYYSLPSGYIMATDEEGKIYGYKKTQASEGTYDRTALSYTWPEGVTQLVYYNDEGNLINTMYCKDTNTNIYPDTEDGIRTYRLKK